MMRRLVSGLLASVLLTSGAATMVTAQEATPTALEELAGTQASEGNPIAPAIGDTVTYFDENGNPAATVTVESIERGWDQFDEYYEPDAGAEYVSFVVTVESTIQRGSVDVQRFDFSLQTANGYLLGYAFTRSETADPPILEDNVSLAADDAETFTLVFLVGEDEPLAHLFWQPESGVLITTAQLAGE